MQQVDSPRGPVSRKALAALQKQLNRKVIDLAECRLGAERAKELERGVITEKGMKNLDPLHAVYAYAQNKIPPSWNRSRNSRFAPDWSKHTPTLKRSTCLPVHR